MRISLFIIGLLGLFTFVGSSPAYKLNSPDNPINDFTKSLALSPNSVYLLLRGSDTKLSGFAKQYNSSHTRASHVALAIYTDSLRIYHVNTTASRRDNLITQTLDQFAYNPDQKHTYLGVWQLAGVNARELSLIEAKISYYKSLDIRFDYRFDTISNRKLYCSEFIYKTLTYANKAKFELPLTTKEVPKNHRFFLKTDTLTYYPTDFFLAWDNLNFMGEWNKAANHPSHNYPLE